MSNQGYIYVLANDSIPDWINLGKSSQSVSGRTSELSRVPGVPTPFLLVFEQLFNDQNAAASYIHSVLSRNGVPKSDNGDFFRASPGYVIDIILGTSGKMSNTNNVLKKENSSFASENEQQDVEILLMSYNWYHLWRKAENTHSGLHGEIQDFKEALNLYSDAAKLGCPMAFERIGDMFRFGQGVQESDLKALEWYRKGVKEGNYFCFMSMAEIYLNNGHLENHQKAFKLYIRTRNEELNIIIEDHASVGNALAGYIKDCIRNKTTPFRAAIPDLILFKGEIMDALYFQYNFHQEHPSPDRRQYSAILAWYEIALRWTDSNL